MAEEIGEDHAIWKAIDRGGGQGADVAGVLREISAAGFKIVPDIDWHAVAGQMGHEVSARHCFAFSGQNGTHSIECREAVAALMREFVRLKVV